MTKKSDTDPNFPPSKAPSSDAWLDAALDDLAKPQALDIKETRSSSAGVDAAEYHAEPRVPPHRAEHNTFPSAPVIVNQTDPGVAPPANEPGPLSVTPKERKLLDKMFEEKRKAAAKELAAQERQADTSPRQNDPHPPGVVTDPPKHGSASAKAGAILFFVALAVIGVIVFVATKRTASSAMDGATSTTSTASIVPTITKTISAPTVSVTPTVEASTTTKVTPTVVRPVITNTALPSATGHPTSTETPTTTSTAAPSSSHPDIKWIEPSIR